MKYMYTYELKSRTSGNLRQSGVSFHAISLDRDVSGDWWHRPRVEVNECRHRLSPWVARCRGQRGKNDAGWPPPLVHTVCWKRKGSYYLNFASWPKCLLFMLTITFVIFSSNSTKNTGWSTWMATKWCTWYQILVKGWFFCCAKVALHQADRSCTDARKGGPPKKAPLPLREGMLPVAIDQPQWQEKTFEQKVTPKKGGFEAVKVRMGR